MTSRNEVRIDIEVEGGAKAERQFNRAEKGARGLGRSTRGLINPLLGAGLVAGILGGGLLGLALSSGSASNSIFRIQGAMEGLIGTITRSLEPAIDRAASFFEKLPVAAQLGVVATAAVLGVVFVKLIGIAAGKIAVAISTHIGAAITSTIAPLVAGLTAAAAAAISAVVVGLASLALIAWDLIFNNGALLKRFEAWLSGMGWIQAIQKWDKEVLTPFFTNAWNKAIGIFETSFRDPFVAEWEALRDSFKQDFVGTFTETIPNAFKAGWDRGISIFRQFFIDIFLAAWTTAKGLFQNDFTAFFTETIPGIFTDGWKAVISIFRSVFVGPLFSIWYATRNAFQGSFVQFFTETIPGIFKGAWEGVISIFRKSFVGPLFTIWYATRNFFQNDFTKFFAETIPGIFTSGWTRVKDLFLGFANSLIGILNRLVSSFGRLPIPTVSVGIAYRHVGFGIKVPYPTFSVGSRPLSSYIGTPRISTIGASPVTIGSPGGAPAARGGPGRFTSGQAGVTNNYYSLAAADFRRETEAIINAPQAQARAVGAP